MTPLTVEDQLLIMTSETEKGWNVEKMIVEFQRDSGNSICCLISYELLSLLASLKG